MEDNQNISDEFNANLNQPIQNRGEPGPQEAGQNLINTVEVARDGDPRVNPESKQSEIQDYRNERPMDVGGRRPVISDEESAQMAHRDGQNNQAQAQVQHPQQYGRNINIQNDRNDGGYGRIRGQHGRTGNQFAPYPNADQVNHGNALHSGRNEGGNGRIPDRQWDRGNQSAAPGRPINEEGRSDWPFRGDPSMTVNEILDHGALPGNYHSTTEIRSRR